MVITVNGEDGQTGARKEEKLAEKSAEDAIRKSSKANFCIVNG
jgi:hypothetical protein